MADPEKLNDAITELRELVEADPALVRRIERDAAAYSWESLELLLARRLQRAAAEAAEAGSRACDVSGVVREIVQDDLVANPGATPGGRMLSECDELVLRQTDVPGLLVSNYVSRRYTIEDAAARELGEIQQVSNPARPVVAASALLDLPELRFDVLDRTIGQTFCFRRAGDQLFVLDEAGTQLGFVHFKETPSLYKVISSLDRGMLQIRPAVERPFQLLVFDNVGDEIGALERRFVGLGPFAGETNCIRVRVEPGRISPGQRLGLLATALLAGIDDERGDRARERDPSHGSSAQPPGS